eukprot:gene15073-23018_t
MLQGADRRRKGECEGSEGSGVPCGAPPALQAETRAFVGRVISEMFRCMEEGSFEDWANRYFSEDLHFVVAAKADDTAHDRACFGRVDMMRYYNNCINNVYSPQASIDMSVSEVTFLSPESVRVDWTINIDNATGATHKCRRFTVSLRGGAVYFVMISAARPEDDMDGQLVSLSLCVPTAEAVVPSAPCPHNAWDSIRAKRGLTMLRCTACGTPWNLSAGLSRTFRCHEHAAGFCPHTCCRRIHVNRRKTRVDERQPYKEPKKPTSPMIAE